MEMGQHVGVRILDVLLLREKGFRRETKLLNMLIFIKSNLWRVRYICIFEIENAVQKLCELLHAIFYNW